SIRRPQVVRHDEILYRGQPTTVRVEEDPLRLGPARVSLSSTGITITRGAVSATPAHRSLANWLRRRAREAIAAGPAAVPRRLNRTPNRVYIMDQRTRWGNCSARGNLSFNWRLVLAPDYVLTYLVAHEAAHLALPDHSRKFWLTVHSLCPQTEQARQWLSAN